MLLILPVLFNSKLEWDNHNFNATIMVINKILILIIYIYSYVIRDVRNKYSEISRLKGRKFDIFSCTQSGLIRCLLLNAIPIGSALKLWRVLILSAILFQYYVALITIGPLIIIDYTKNRYRN